MNKKYIPGAKNTIIYSTKINTPIGTLYAGAVNNGICFLEFSDRKNLKSAFQKIAQEFHAKIVDGPNKYFELLENQLGEYFTGVRKNFTVPVIYRGTSFQKQVWKELQGIPYGKTLTYGQLAEKIQKPEAVRAVANSIGRNSMAIITPCHRIIGAQGKLTGYAWGVWRKKWLLELEQTYS